MIKHQKNDCVYYIYTLQDYRIMQYDEILMSNYSCNFLEYSEKVKKINLMLVLVILSYIHHCFQTMFSVLEYPREASSTHWILERQIGRGWTVGV